MLNRHPIDSRRPAGSDPSPSHCSTEFPGGIRPSDRVGTPVRSWNIDLGETEGSDVGKVYAYTTISGPHTPRSSRCTTPLGCCRRKSWLGELQKSLRVS